MRYALALLALLSFVPSSHAGDFGAGWDTKNGHQRMAAATAYANENGFDCSAYAPRNQTEAQRKELELMRYSWALVKVGIHTMCTAKKVVTVQASAQIVRKPHVALKKPPVVVAEKPKAKESAPWPLSPWPEVRQPVEPQKETLAQMLIRWAQKLWYWQTSKPAS